MCGKGCESEARIENKERNKIMQPSVKTASDLKYHVERNGHEPHFFTRSSMKFFGDTMRNYGVRKAVVDTHFELGVQVWELYRKRPVKHGMADSAYFHAQSFNRVFPVSARVVNQSRQTKDKENGRR